MPRHAPVLECSPEDKETLVAISKSRNEELRIVERAQIILASLEGKEIQQMARELGLSIPTVDKWRRRFSLFGLRGLWDQPRSGKPAKYDAHFRNRVLALLEQPPPPHLSLGWTRHRGEAGGQCVRGVAGLASRRHLPAKAA